ncbi:MAG: hypothetical protein QXX95_06965 [Nitrososphaerales archaeon]
MELIIKGPISYGIEIGKEDVSPFYLLVPKNLLSMPYQVIRLEDNFLKGIILDIKVPHRALSKGIAKFESNN